MSRLELIDMVVLLVLLVLKTCITIVYDFLYPQRSKQFHRLPSIVEGSIGYTCSLANETDPPHAPRRRTVCS